MAWSDHDTIPTGRIKYHEPRLFGGVYDKPLFTLLPESESRYPQRHDYSPSLGDELTRDIAKLKIEKHKLEKESITIRAQLSNLSLSKKEGDLKIRTLTADNAFLRSRASDLGCAVNNLQQDLQDMGHEKLLLQDLLDQSKSFPKAKVAELEDCKLKQSIEIEGLKSTVEILTSQLNSQTDQVEALKKSLQQYQQAVADLQEDVHTLDTELTKYTQTETE